jgi:uncharacterized phage protein (TIGR02220 family)
MDYTNEAFVKVYPNQMRGEDWLILSWQARSTLLHCTGICDRSGVIETRRGAAGIAALIRGPVEDVTNAIEELLREGQLETHPAGYLIPWWLESQEARQSDKARQRASRARRRAGVIESQDGVTIRDNGPDDGHTPSRDVTIDQRDRSDREDPARALAEVAVYEINRLAGSRYQADSAGTLKDAKALAKRGVTAEDIRRVLAAKWSEWSRNDHMRPQFKPSVLLRPSNFAKYREDLDARAPAKSVQGRLAIPKSDHIVLDDDTIIERQAS